MHEVDYYKIKEKEILNNDKIRVHVVDSNVDLYNDIARVMLNKIKENNEKRISTSFILPVGPRGQYRRFARLSNIEKISCKNLVTINMDEYLDSTDRLIPENHPLSFRGFMKSNLFDLLDDKLKIKPENVFFPDPENPSQIKELISELGGVDICFGGVGINGHIAFNEPIDDELITNDEFKALETRILDVLRETIAINSLSYGGHTEIVPRRCITIGVSEILMARELRFYLEHDWQSAVLKKIIFTNPTPSFPATFLKEHFNSSLTISKNVLSGMTDEN
ncbi:MAG: glucosamine-6-phosphate isomerase [Actinobacteria bacterium]|nr:glucosamine-6-phosphate isomerase [Actinomycetota bacterium]